MSNLSRIPLASTDWMKGNQIPVIDTDEGEQEMIDVQKPFNGKKQDDIGGQTFNSLTAICDTGRKDKYGYRLWLFRCACGKEAELNVSNVKAGRLKSCGCLARVKGKTGIAIKPQVRPTKVIAPLKQEPVETGVSLQSIPPPAVTARAPELLAVTGRTVGMVIDFCENISLDDARSLVEALDAVELNLPGFVPGADELKVKVEQYRKAARAFLKFREEIEAI